MTQKQRVINYIKIYGSITPLDAFRDLGITKLATVISDMRRIDGMEIFQHLDYSYNRFGDRCRYMRYWLDEELFVRDTEGEDF